MYNGGLLTIRIRDRSSLLCISLLDLSAELRDGQLFLRDKKKDKDLGYFSAVYGISLDEFMQKLGFELDESAQIPEGNNV